MKQKVEADVTFSIELGKINVQLNRWDVRRMKTGEMPSKTEVSKFWKRYVKVANQLDKAGISTQLNRVREAKRLVLRFKTYEPKLYRL